MAEIPELSALAASGRAEVVGIALDSEGAAAVRPFIAEREIEYRVLLGDQDLFTRFNGFAIPYTLALDPSWRVVNLYRGPATLVELQRDLDSLDALVDTVAAGP
jgi:cytochrome c biogenesis protein CcmG/thiol:disulfide interchange protein DsbE